MEPFPFAAHDGRLCGSDSRMGLSWVLGAVPEPWVCLPRGSPLQSRVAKGLLKYVSVTCPKQHEIAQISCFQLEENPVKCGRGRRGAEASVKFLPAPSCFKGSSYSHIPRPASSWLLCPSA